MGCGASVPLKSLIHTTGVGKVGKSLLTVTVVSVKLLVDSDLLSEGDPYLILKAGEQQVKTKTRQDSNNAVLSERHVLVVGEDATSLEFLVYDENPIKDKLIGRGEVQLDLQFKSLPQGTWQRQFELKDKAGQVAARLKFHWKLSKISKGMLRSAAEQQFWAENIAAIRLSSLHLADKSHSHVSVHMSLGLQAFVSPNLTASGGQGHYEMPIFSSFTFWRGSLDRSTVVKLQMRHGSTILGHAYLDLANQANKGVQSVKLHILPPDKRMTTDTTAEEAVIRENLNASAQGFSSSLGNIELLFALQPRKKACEMLFKALAFSFKEDEKGDSLSMTHSAVRGAFAAIHIRLPPQTLNQWLVDVDEDSSDSIELNEFGGLLLAAVDFSAENRANISSALARMVLERGRAGGDREDGEGEEGGKYVGLLDGFVQSKTAFPVAERSHGQDAKLQVMDRRTGLMVQEHIPTYLRFAFSMMYGTQLGKAVASLGSSYAIFRAMTKWTGKTMSSSKSLGKIDDFVKLHSLDRSEIKEPEGGFTSFNDFFAHELKEGSRPVSEPDNERCLVSPADCRMVVFQDVHDATRLWIKGDEFTIAGVLGEAGKRNFDGGLTLADRYDGGSIAVARLSPQDYHRWHLPCKATLGKRTEMGRELITVNPAAVNTVNVFNLNKRVVQELYTQEFGLVCLVVVGATMVGSITFVQDEGKEGDRGSQNGYFQFGGSTVLLFFEPGAVVFDKDLVATSLEATETVLKCNERIGMAPKQ